MEIKNFVFIPDGHYGYPESTGGDSPYGTSDLIEMFVNSDCSAYNMSGDEPSEPDRDDFETDEEYDEAYEEWESEKDDYASEMFANYGNYDVFHNEIGRAHV